MAMYTSWADAGVSPTAMRNISMASMAAALGMASFLQASVMALTG